MAAWGAWLPRTVMRVSADPPPANRVGVPGESKQTTRSAAVSFRAGLAASFRLACKANRDRRRPTRLPERQGQARGLVWSVHHLCLNCYQRVSFFPLSPVLTGRLCGSQGGWHGGGPMDGERTWSGGQACTSREKNEPGFSSGGQPHNLQGRPARVG